MAWCGNTPPGHGQKDFVVGRTFGLAVDNPVGGDGRFLPTTPIFAGEKVFDANKHVVEVLAERGALLHHEAFREGLVTSGQGGHVEPSCQLSVERYSGVQRAIGKSDAAVQHQLSEGVVHLESHLPHLGRDSIQAEHELVTAIGVRGQAPALLRGRSAALLLGHAEGTGPGGELA